MRRVGIFFLLGLIPFLVRLAPPISSLEPALIPLIVRVAPDATASAVDGAIEEAVLVDFASRMQPAHGDDVMRRHLARTMTFLEGEVSLDADALQRRAHQVGLSETDPIVRSRRIESAREALAQVDPELMRDRRALRRYFRAHRGEFTVGPIIEFEHVFLRRQGRGGALSADAARLAEDLRSGKLDVTEAWQHADVSLAVRPRERSTLRSIRLRHGEAIATILAAGTPGAWVGPVESARGAHLLRVISLEPVTPASFESIEARVRAAFAASLREENFRRRFRRIRDRYDITVVRLGAGDAG